MRIKSFTIQNYRSITKAYKIPLSKKMTVLIGKNNEGKSNILSALSGAFFIISAIKDGTLVSGGKLLSLNRIGSRGRLRNPLNEQWSYDFTRDCPISKQQNKQTETVFRLDFELTSEEKIDFRKQTECNFNNELPFSITIKEDTTLCFQIPKRYYGGGIPKFKQKINEIASFISQNLDSIYIPAIRPIGTSMVIIEELMQKAVQRISSESQEYKEAREKIDEIHKQALKTLETSLSSILVKFIPAIKSVELGAENIEQFSRVNVSEIQVDDGVKTSIHYKGDGLKSLMAIALMHARDTNGDKDFTIAIEEPESHLHPDAIRQIKRILSEVAEKNQVIISTHSPILINRYDLGSNIIVRNNSAHRIADLREIRNELGVAICDNLMNAEYILLVEGDTDKMILSSWLSAKSTTISAAIKEGRLHIHPLKGVVHLETAVSHFRAGFCDVIAYIDFDKAAKEKAKSVIELGGLEKESIMYPIVNGKRESELEDLFAVTSYKDLLPAPLSVDWRKNLVKERKWSDNIAQVYKAKGLDFDDEAKTDLKVEIAKKIESEIKENIFTSFEEDRTVTLMSLMEKLEMMLCVSKQSAGI